MFYLSGSNPFLWVAFSLRFLDVFLYRSTISNIDSFGALVDVDDLGLSTCGNEPSLLDPYLETSPVGLVQNLSGTPVSSHASDCLWEATGLKMEIMVF
jgi:hypothetical protein